MPSPPVGGVEATIALQRRRLAEEMLDRVFRALRAG